MLEMALLRLQISKFSGAGGHLLFLSAISVLSIGPGTCQSSGGYSVESQWVYLVLKNSPEKNYHGPLILLWRVLSPQ